MPTSREEIRCRLSIINTMYNKLLSDDLTSDQFTDAMDYIEQSTETLKRQLVDLNIDIELEHFFTV